MLGAFSQLSLDFGIRDTDTLTYAHSGFFQDEWKVNPRLTLTLGFATTVSAVDREEQPHQYRCAGPAIDGRSRRAPGSSVPWRCRKGLAPADMNNFAPRIGLAWDVFGTGKTAVRAGYGVYYESVNADSLAQENPPFAGFAHAYNGNVADPFGSTGQTAPPAVTHRPFRLYQNCRVSGL